MDEGVVGKLIGTVITGSAFVYAAVHTWKFFNKHQRYTEWLEACKNAHKNEDNDTPLDVDEYLRQLKNTGDKLKPVILKGTVQSKVLAERLRLGITENKDYQNLDIYTKTTEISHGYSFDTFYEQSLFYIGNQNKVCVELGNGDATPIINAHTLGEREQMNYIYFPLYLLGLTSTTSYTVEYLSSNETINICGIVDWKLGDAQIADSIQISNPFCVFIGSISDAIQGIKDGIKNNLIKLAICGTATVLLGALCFRQLRYWENKIARKVESAERRGLCMMWKQNKPVKLRRPWMHIYECKWCYTQQETRNSNLNQQCPKCGEVSTSVHEIFTR